MVECVNVENLNIKGLMTLGPQSQNPQKTRETFIYLRSLLNDINKQTPNNRLNELSMGMSGDYIIAVASKLLAQTRNDEVVRNLAQVMADLVRGKFELLVGNCTIMIF